MENSVTLQLASFSKTYGYVSFDILFKSSGSVSMKVKVEDTKIYTIVYNTSETVMKTTKATITYGIGPTREWRRITRDLSTDLSKAMGMKRERKIELQSLTLQGLGYIGT